MSDTTTMHGRDATEWAAAVDVVWPFLKELARDHGMTTYTDVNDVVERRGLTGFNFNHAAGRNAIGHLLALVVHRDREAEKWQPGEGLMISALVIHKGGSDTGRRFYGLAQDLGLLHMGRLTDAEKDAFLVQQINAVWNHYGTHTLA